MKIAVVGAGGVGGYFGGRLAAAGLDIGFVARGRHLEAMRRDGLIVESPLGRLHLPRVKASDNPADLGLADFVIIAVKLWDTDAAVAALGPLVGPDTEVVSFQNGIEAADRLIAALGRQHVAGGVAHIAATLAAPGLIRHTGTLARLTVGTFDGGPGRAVDAFILEARRAGIDIHGSSDIRRAIWEKFVFLATFSGVTTLTRQPIGPVRDDPDMRGLLEAALAEAVQVARGEGIALPLDHLGKVMTFIDGAPSEMKSSMLCDLERGSRLELPWLSGTVCRLGQGLAIPTPVHQTILAGLKPFMLGPPA